MDWPILGVSTLQGEGSSEVVGMFSCPRCGDSIPTRVLADSVTLVVVGECQSHGVLEVSRVYLGELPEPYPAASPTAAERDVPESVNAHAYKPGACCGRRLGEHGWCHLPVDHQEPHAA
jgi:hypothetical protein